MKNIKIDLNSDFLKIAAKMFHVDGSTEFLSDPLALYLTIIHERCRRAGGRLCSRQAIAIAVAAWMEIHPDMVAYRI